MFQITNPELFRAAVARAQATALTVEQARQYREAQRRYSWVHMTQDYIGGHSR